MLSSPQAVNGFHEQFDAVMTWRPRGGSCATDRYPIGRRTLFCGLRAEGI